MFPSHTTCTAKVPKDLHKLVVKVQILSVKHVLVPLVIPERPCFVIQEYSYPWRWSCFNVSTLIIVPERETKHRAVQTPGELVHSKPSFVALTFPGYTVVRHSNANLLPSPLQLPVATALQGLSAQHLLPVVKPVRVVGDRRRTLEVRGFSAVFREAELRVGCVWIQSEICPVWYEKWKTLRLKPLHPCIHINAQTTPC